MKYYGSVYLGAGRKYDLSGLRAYDDPYEALLDANAQWNAEPDQDPECARLLVVIQTENRAGREITVQEAFFQFTDSKACRVFAAKREDFSWATEESQNWNGNASFMT